MTRLDRWPALSSSLTAKFVTSGDAICRVPGCALAPLRCFDIGFQAACFLVFEPIFDFGVRDIVRLTKMLYSEGYV